MRPNGFSLIELIITIAIAGILMALATLNFSSWLKKGSLERQVKEMYTEIQSARLQAAHTKKIYSIDLAANSMVFKSYSSEADIAGTTTSQKNLDFPISWSGWTNPASNRILFDTNGFSLDPVSPKLLCVFSSYGPAYDTVLVMQAKTSMGKIVDQGGGCVKTNVAPK